MKNHIKILSVLGIFAFFTQTAFAQPTITLEGFGGWLWTAKAGYNNNIKVDDKGNYGIRAGILQNPKW